MKLVCSLQLYESGQRDTSHVAQQQQLKLDLATLPQGADSTFEDLGNHLEAVWGKSRRS
jgi:hypothetical protein